MLVNAGRGRHLFEESDVAAYRAGEEPIGERPPGYIFRGQMIAKGTEAVAHGPGEAADIFSGDLRTAANRSYDRDSEGVAFRYCVGSQQALESASCSCVKLLSGAIDDVVSGLAVA